METDAVIRKNSRLFPFLKVKPPRQPIRTGATIRGMSEIRPVAATVTAGKAAHRIRAFHSSR